MEVSVIVPARDAAGTLPSCLDGLGAQDLRASFEVVVVDNGSSDATREIAERHPVVDRVVPRVRGEGPGAARNEGVRAARAARVAFLDSDCIPTPGWLRAGLAVDADIVQGRVTPPPGALVGPFDHTLWVTAEHGLYETANLFVARDWFERAGGFRDFIDTRHERPFGEDAWFAWRARRQGARTAFCDDALVHHAVLPGDLGAYLAERRREGLFARLVALCPELRDHFLFAGVFLNRRSAAFDATAVALALAAATRSRIPLLAALPWLRMVVDESTRRTGTMSGKVALAVAAGDAIAAASLWSASIRTRSAVL